MESTVEVADLIDAPTILLPAIATDSEASEKETISIRGRSLSTTSASSSSNASIFDISEETEIISKLKTSSSLDTAVDSNTGRMLLHVACENNFFALINVLLRRQVNLDCTDSEGRTPLHLCTHEKAVRLLCSHGANVSLLDKEAQSAMHVFITKRLIACIQIMLSYDFDPSLSRTMDPTTLELVSHQSCVHYAAQCEDLEVLTVLITEARALGDINVRDNDGNTVLHRVAEIHSGTPVHQKALMVLLDKGALPDARNNAGASTLHMLCANRSFSEAEMIEPLIELLLNMNCDPNFADYSGCTPLIIACAHREWAVCKVLMQFGADMNAPCRLDSELLLRSQSMISGRIRTTSADSSAGDSPKSLPSPTYVPFSEISDCTASDLFPRRARADMFSAISSPQTWVPDDNRDRCMNCAELFVAKFTLLSFFAKTKGAVTRHHCRHCARLICSTCLIDGLSRDKLPSFVQKQFPTEKYFKLCIVCHNLFSKK